jgi:uncharacterized protein (DUF342 family)
VRGDVLKDFRIDAIGDISVQGSAVNSLIVSRDGAVAVGGTAFGATAALHATSEGVAHGAVSRTYITAGADFRARGAFKAINIQGATVEAGGDILVEHEASNSLLNTRGSLLLPHGHLFGGEARVVGGVEAAKVGTPLMGRTVIHLCSDVESTFEYAHLLYRIHQHENAREVLSLHLGPYAKHPERLRFLRDQYRKKLEGLYQKLRTIERNLQTLSAKKEALLAEAKPSTTPRVNFHGVFHRGSVVYVGEQFFTPEEDIAGPKAIEYYGDTKSFAVTELNPLRPTG